MHIGEIIYSLGTQTYYGAIRLASIWDAKASKMISGRQESKLKWINWNAEGKSVVWFHCASLGEFEQGRPVIEAFKTAFPDWKIVLTFFSPSGYEIRKNYQGADLIVYLPFDSPQNAREFISKIKPEMAIFVKYEYWFFLLKTLHELNIPILSISAIFRTNQVFFKPWGSLHRKMLGFFKHFFVQDVESARLLSSIHLPHYTITGDTRFDRVIQVKANSKPIPEIEEFAESQTLFICGSVWPEDRKVLQPLIKNEKINCKWVIVPHDLHENDLQAWEAILPEKSHRYSSGKAKPGCKLLILDTIGLLSSAYRYAEMAYIGGAFGKGLHNTLEAAVYGVPVFFGNLNYLKFREAVGLTKAGGAFAISDSKALTEKVLELTENKTALKEKGLICARFVEENAGATQKILSRLKEWIAPKA